MKKTLMAILVVLLALTMFVACKDDNDDLPDNYIAELEFENAGAIFGDNEYYLIVPAKATMRTTEKLILYTDKACKNPSAYTIQFYVKSSGSTKDVAFKIYENTTEVYVTGPTSISGKATVSSTSPYTITFYDDAKFVFNAYAYSSFTGTVELEFEGNVTYQFQADI